MLDYQSGFRLPKPTLKNCFARAVVKLSTSFLFQMETEGEERGDDELIALGGIDSSLNQDATGLLNSSFIDPCSGEYVHQPAASKQPVKSRI